MMLGRCDQNYNALDAKGLALTGLAVLEGAQRVCRGHRGVPGCPCDHQGPRDRRPRAAATRRPAPADAAGVLSPIYPAAEGREIGPT